MPHSGDNHPDLIDIGRSLQRRLDRVLEAEQEAARVIARRSASLRDRLIDAEDAASVVTLHVRAGVAVSGTVAIVALDHVELHDGTRALLVPLETVMTVELA